MMHEPRLLFMAVVVAGASACGWGNPSRGYGYALSASLGTYSDGTDRLGLSILATLRDSQGRGPAEGWTAILRDEDDTIISGALPYEASGEGSAVAWWLPLATARSGATFTLELSRGGAQLSVPLSLSTLEALSPPEPALAADANRLSWPAVTPGATALCRVTQAGALELSLETAAGECDVSALPPGDYTASIVAFSGDLAAIRATSSDAPDLPDAWHASESRLGFVRPPEGGSPVTLRAAGGPFFFGASQPGLALLVDLRDGGASPSEAWTVDVVGPGLPETNPLRFTVPASTARRVAWSYDAAASPGVYSAVARAGARSVSTLFTVAEGGTLVAPFSVSATAESSGGLTVSWLADAGARSHFVGVWSGGSFAGGQWVTGTSANFGSSSFTAGQTYDVYVTSTDADLSASAFPSRLVAAENAFSPATFTAR